MVYDTPSLGSIEDPLVSNQALASPDWRMMLNMGASPHGVMKGDGNRNRRSFGALLHNPVAAALTGRNKSVLFENLTNLRA